MGQRATPAQGPRVFPVVWYRFRAGIRRRWSGYVAIAAVVALLGGMAMGAMASFMFQSMGLGTSFSCEFIAMSQVISCPVYAAIRPMIANIVQSLFGAAYEWPLGAAVSVCILLTTVVLLSLTGRLEKRWSFK